MYDHHQFLVSGMTVGQFFDCMFLDVLYQIVPFEYLALLL